MIRKLLFISLAATLMLVSYEPATAQMSDDAVVQYVKDGMAMGKSQNDIIKELAAAGVTKEQAQRIKTQMERGQESQTEADKMVGAQERRRRINLGVLENEETTIGSMSENIVEKNETKEIFGHSFHLPQVQIFRLRSITGLDLEMRSS